MSDKKKNGRPEKKIVVTPAEMVEALCSRLCPTDDIATELGIARATLYTRFPDAIKKGHARARNELRQWQFDSAKKGNPALLIWLGKQYLGQTDKLPDFTKLSDDELRRFIAGSASGDEGATESESDEGATN